MKQTVLEDAVFKQVEGLREEMTGFLRELVRIPTTNPPGECYSECAELIARRLERFDYQVIRIPAEGRPEHTPVHPRLNVLGRLRESAPGRVLHFNGHFDVVPAGAGWTLNPFEAVEQDGKIFGRGTSDQKAGIAASIFAVEALRRCGVRLRGAVEQSATVDEESGGFAGVGYLVERGYLSRTKTDYVVITEPLNVDRVCLGHRGVYWFRVSTIGRTAHGSMPFLGVSAIDNMNEFISALRADLKARLPGIDTSLPVTPAEARRPTLNINSIAGGQADDGLHTPCVADLCTAVFDRRFLPEETHPEVKASVLEILDRLGRNADGFEYRLEDLMVVPPVQTSPDSPLVSAFVRSIGEVLGKRAEVVASPGTYDQKHIVTSGNIEDCIAYGPGLLEMAHRPDEYCRVEDMVHGAQVMALSTLRLLGVAG